MPSSDIKNVDIKSYEKSQLRNAVQEVTIQEAAQIISDAAPVKITAVFQKYFGSKNGVNLAIPAKGKPDEPIDFDG